MVTCLPRSTRIHRGRSTARAWGLHGRRDDDVPTLRVGARCRDVIEALGRAGLSTEPAVSSTTAVLDTFDGRLAEAGLRLELVDHHHLVLSGEGGVPAGITVAAQPGSPTTSLPGRCATGSPDCSTCGRLLRLVEVTSRRSAGTRRNGSGKATVAVTVHRHRRQPASPWTTHSSST